MTTGVSAATANTANAALAKAKSVHTKATQSLNKEKQLEQKDMSKANSIFTEAQNVEKKANDKTGQIKAGIDEKYTAAQNKVEQTLAEVKSNEQIVNAQKDLLEQKQTRKKELENAHPELKGMSKGKKSGGTKTTQQPEMGADGKPVKGSKQPISNNGGEAENNLDPAIVQEYSKICGEIKCIQQILLPAQGKLESGKERLASDNERLKNVVDSGSQKLHDHVMDTDSKLSGKISKYSTIVQSQSKSKGTNDAQAKAAGDAKIAVDKKIDAENLKEKKDTSLIDDLKEVSNNLKDVKGKTEELSTKNNININKDIPQYKENIRGMSMNVDSGVTSEIEALQSNYSTYVNDNIKQYIDNAGSAEGIDSKKGDLASDAAGKAGDTATKIANGDNIEDTIKDAVVGTLMDAGMSALDKVFPGLGSGLSMLGSIFGL